MARVGIIGAGYVGLPTAAILSRFGHSVIVAERDPKRLARLQSGHLPIVEPGLDEMVAESVQKGLLEFSEKASDAARDADFVFLCVATPERPDGSADLSFVEAAAAEIGPHLRSGAIVVNKSTVPVGTADLVANTIGRDDVGVVSNPEFLREGTAVPDSLKPDRIVVGAVDGGAAKAVADLFSPTGAPVIITDAVTAETIKYASNAFLAAKLSFVNALANLCESVGADVDGLLQGIGSDHRIGFHFLSPGPGWGGSCLPKDTRALVAIAQSAGYDFALLRATIDANDDHQERVVAKVASSITGSSSGSLKGETVAVWGLTFKANTDDRRRSPALDVVAKLLQHGAKVVAYDPTVNADEAVPEDVGAVALAHDCYEAVSGAKALVVLTEWSEFKEADLQKVAALMANKAIIDARNLLDADAVRGAGFTYKGIGRS